MRRRRLVRAPASSANLGPGFDSFAVALGLHLELEVVESGRFAVETALPVRKDRDNLCVRGFERLCPAERFTFRVSSKIPLAGGLGSSAAAFLAGLLAAADLFELEEDLLAHATALEGHPDNAAAALHGGFVICAEGRVAKLGVPDGLEALAVVPKEQRVPTARARALLPQAVPLADAVFNVAHASLLTLGLKSGDLELIAEGLQDRLHQPYRAPLYPQSAALLGRAPALGALGATLSGAGPTVLVWCHYEQTGAVLKRLEGEVGGWAAVVRVPFELQGAYVASL